MSSPSSEADLHVAVLLTATVQLLDLSAVDLFAMLGKDYLQTGLPQPIVNHGIEVKITYVGLPSQLSPSETAPSGLQDTTAHAQVQLTASTKSPSVQPGQVDVLLIPGPDPTKPIDEETCDFVRRHAKQNKVGNGGRTAVILTICTGCLIPASAGIYDGRVASAPRAFVPKLKNQFPKVTWDGQRRWVKDEREGATTIWSSGGITNGLEMTAAYLKETYPGPLSEVVCEMAGVGDKGEFYDTAVGVDNAWWLGQILRALFTGKKGRKG